MPPTPVVIPLKVVEPVEPEIPVPVIPEEPAKEMEDQDEEVEETGEVAEEEEDIGFLEDIHLNCIRDREDSVDRTIRSQLSRQRVAAWSKAEDRLMLLAFIGSSLFLQKYSFDIVFEAVEEIRVLLEWGAVCSVL